MTGGHFKARIYRELIQSRWSPFRRRELARVRKALAGKLKADGYHLRWHGYRSLSLRRREGLSEVARSFSISIEPLSQRYDAEALVPEIVGLMQDGHDVFYLTSEAGNGKAVLGMLLPLLCHRTPKNRSAALYLSHTDWAQGAPRTTERVKSWLESWPNEIQRLLIIDSANEFLYKADLSRLVVELRDSKLTCGFLFLCRPATPGKTGDIALALAALFQKQARELKLFFNPKQAAQCRVFRHLFPRAKLDEHQIGHLLLAYLRLFPGYALSRFSAVLVLRHLIETFRKAPEAESGGVPIRPPGDVIFDRILLPGIDLEHPSVELVSRIAFDLIRAGRHTAAEDLGAIEGRLLTDGFVLAKRERLGDALGTARRYLREHSAVALQIDGKTMRIPNELHVRALAALRIARLISAAGGSPVPGLQELRGRSKYDPCAPFLLPAYRRIRGAPEALYQFLEGFLAHNDAPFSLCARLIQSNYDFSLIRREEIENLNRELFRQLVQAIDADRQTTCEQSIREASGPNPLLDQLFEVVAAYGDSVLRLLVDNVLLTSKKDLEKSQGAYLILAWLHGLLSPRHAEDLPERRHHVYVILNGLEVLTTRNLHVRFHLVEVLEVLTAAHGEAALQCLPALEERRKSLLERFGQAPAPEETAAQSLYDECDALVRSWAQTLARDSAATAFYRQAADVLPALLRRFEELLRGHDIPSAGGEISHPIGEDELEVILECYEVLLGLARRTYYRHAWPGLRRFIEEASHCPFWIVRWWAFYNMSRLALEPGLSAVRLSTCLGWMLDQACREAEPIGLKHRQVALLEYLVEERSGADRLLGEIFAARASLDESWIMTEYAKIRNDDHAPAEELEEYFNRLRKLHSRLVPEPLRKVHA